MMSAAYQDDDDDLMVEEEEEDLNHRRQDEDDDTSDIKMTATTSTTMTTTAVETTNDSDNHLKTKEFYEHMIKTIPIQPARSAELMESHNNYKSRVYWDRSHYDSPESQLRALHNSSTLYVGNLNFTTRLCHIRYHFENIGPVRTIIMGIDRFKKTPCGFCFVQYYRRCHALMAISYLSGTSLDHHIIRVELDAGFKDGRQYGRGQHGGQVRDYKKMTKQQSLYPTGSSLHYTSPRSGDKRSLRNMNDNYYQRTNNPSRPSHHKSENDTSANRPNIDDALPTARSSSYKGSSHDDINPSSNIKKEEPGDDDLANNEDEPTNDETNEINNDNDNDEIIQDDDDNDRPTKRLRT